MNMTAQSLPGFSVALLLIIVVVGGLICLTWYRRFTGLERGQAGLLCFTAMALAAGPAVVYRARQLNGGLAFGGNRPEAFLTLLSTGALVLLLVPFLAKLYVKWVGGRVSEDEKAPGMNGVRAWLRGGNLVCAGLISLCAAIGFGYSFWAVLLITTASLVAYPALKTLGQGPNEVVKSENLSSERERVLKMLEEGKINASESAELLSALGQTVQPARPQNMSLNTSRKTVLVGMTLVLLGFFLPWFSFNPGHEVNRQLQNLVPNFPGADFMQNVPLNIKTGSVTITGGDVRHGLGWLVLLLGIAVAALPYLALRLDTHTERMLVVGALGLGALIMLFLLTQNFRFVSIGLLMGLVGYALEFFGTVHVGRTASESNVT